MNIDAEWVDEEFWIEVEQKGLYPPEKETKIAGALSLIQDEDFAGKRVLDVGCGTGWFGALLQDRGARVIGSDISDTLLREAARRIPVVRASAYRLPFPDESFDCAISFMVLHVLETPEQALREVSRALAPAGKFYLGIVHPEAERWDEATGSCFSDLSSYESIEVRP